MMFLENPKTPQASYPKVPEPDMDPQGLSEPDVDPKNTTVSSPPEQGEGFRGFSSPSPSQRTHHQIIHGLFADRVATVMLMVVNVVLLVVFATSGFLVWLDHHYAGRIYPNVTIRGLPVGKMTPQQAWEALQQRYAEFLSQPVIIRYHEQVWTPTLEDLGARVGFDRAVERAMRLGRRSGYPENLRQIAMAWYNGWEIPLEVVVDEQTVQNYLLRISAEVNRPAVDAQLLVVDDVPIAIPAAPGRQVQVNEMVEDIVAALQQLEPQHVLLRTLILMPLLSTEDAQHARKVAETIIQSPLILKTDNGQEAREWVWSTSDIGRLVKISRTERPDHTGDHFVISLDEHEIYRRVTEIAAKTRTAVVYPRVDWNGGNLRIIKEGKSGRELDTAQATRLIVTTLLSSTQRVVDLPFREGTSPITAANLSQLGITELLAVGRSDFAGSEAYRITNIQAGMRQLHGILVAPGEVFSFNDNISIAPEHGYVEGYAIIHNRTQLEWGGGICQDSTTMFRAAFWAGFPILERWGHSFYISWYDKYGYGEYGDGPGMDATIFTGGPDLRFQNDTNHWILIQTMVDVARTLAEVRIYGTNPGRTVRFQGPRIFNRTPPPAAAVYIPDPSLPPGGIRRSDSARGGMDIAFTRIVEQDGKVRRDEFLTRFKPWPNIYLVHPARYAAMQPQPASPTSTPEGIPTANNPEVAIGTIPTASPGEHPSSPDGTAPSPGATLVPPPDNAAPPPEATPVPPPSEAAPLPEAAPVPPPDNVAPPPEAAPVPPPNEAAPLPEAAPVPPPDNVAPPPEATPVPPPSDAAPLPEATPVSPLKDAAPSPGAVPIPEKPPALTSEQPTVPEPIPHAPPPPPPVDPLSPPGVGNDPEH